MKTPVALFIFNRPKTTEKVFAAIRQAKPLQLLVVADGPRSDYPEDIEKCQTARAIIEGADWDCQVLKNYSNTNLGCGRRVASGLDWVFSTVERAIIFEDDCLPNPSFFQFCEELLEKYQDEQRIMTILGTNNLGRRRAREQSYCFTCWPSPAWGWASWSRAWSHFNYDISAWDNRETKTRIRATMADDALFLNMAWRFDQAWQKVLQKEVDIWDWQWYFAILSHEGLAIVPSVNLISNIGFGPNATHTLSRFSRVINRQTYCLEFPLSHPETLAPDLDYQEEIKKVKLWGRIKNQLKQIKNQLKQINLTR